jgi:hypothetical protein
VSCDDAGWQVIVVVVRTLAFVVVRRVPGLVGLSPAPTRSTSRSRHCRLAALHSSAIGVVMQSVLMARPPLAPRGMGFRQAAAAGPGSKRCATMDFAAGQPGG